MEAGRLRHWLTFETLTVEQDSDGAMVETWGDAFVLNSRMPCDVVHLSGRELIAAQSMHSKVNARIKVRYRPGFLAKMRATDGATTYNIEAVIPDMDSGRRFLTLLCSSGVNAV